MCGFHRRTLSVDSGSSLDALATTLSFDLFCLARRRGFAACSRADCEPRKRALELSFPLRTLNRRAPSIPETAVEDPSIVVHVDRRHRSDIHAAGCNFSACDVKLPEFVKHFNFRNAPRRDQRIVRYIQHKEILRAGVEHRYWQC